MQVSNVYCEPFHIKGGQQFEIHKVEYSTDDQYSCFMHFHEVHEFILFDDVDGQYSHCQGKHAIQSQDIVFTPANEIHDFDINEGKKSWVIVQFVPSLLSSQQLRAYNDIFSNSGIFRLNTERRNFLRTLSDELFNTYHTAPNGPRGIFLLQLIISTIAEYGQQIDLETKNLMQHTPAHKKLQPLITFMRSQDNLDMTLGQAAEMCFLSPSYFSKLFKSVYNTSFSEYKIKHKVHAAARNLMVNQNSITHLSYEYNFANPSHFIFQFKKQFGLTPKQYQKKFHQ